MARLLLFTTLVVSTVLLAEAAPESSTNLPIDTDNEVNTNSSQTLVEKFASVQERNKRVVLNLLRALFIDKNLDEVDKYIADGDENYIQHSPFVPDGRQHLKDTIQKIYDAGRLDFEVLRVAAEGDLVFAHSKHVSTYVKSLFGADTVSTVDILRVKDGKCVEHWAIVQALPEKSVSKHPLF